MMAQINTTGNDDIDMATAEIAVALSAEHPGSNNSYCYRLAERLRDAIMKGTRELDAPEPPLDDFRVSGQAADDMSFTEPVL